MFKNEGLATVYYDNGSIQVDVKFNEQYEHYAYYTRLEDFINCMKFFQTEKIKINFE